MATMFERLPLDVQEKVKNDLMAYDETFVEFENGEYHVSTMIGVRRIYAKDHEFIGTYRAEEIFTTAERRENYQRIFNEKAPSCIIGKDRLDANGRNPYGYYNCFK